MNLISFVALATDVYNERGRKGEQLAAAYLQRLGYRIVARNFRVHAVGEIDIIALAGDTLVAVEVKHWYRYSFRQLEYIIDARKKERMEQTLEVFLQQYPSLGKYALRFDLLLINREGAQHLTSIVE